MRIRWTVPVADDLESIRNYLQRHNPPVRRTNGPDDLPAVRSLKRSPGRGRPGHRAGTRELALTPLPYVIVYSLKAEAIETLHIHHPAQDWR